MGGGARFRVGIALSAIGEGLREAARDFGGASLRCVCLPLSAAGSGHPPHKFITPSRLDFSHLSQTGWSRSPPICSKRGHVKAPTRPAFPILTTKLAAALRKDYSETSSPNSRVD